MSPAIKNVDEYIEEMTFLFVHQPSTTIDKVLMASDQWI